MSTSDCEWENETKNDSLRYTGNIHMGYMYKCISVCIQGIKYYNICSWYEIQIQIIVTQIIFMIGINSSLNKIII